MPGVNTDHAFLVYEHLATIIGPPCTYIWYLVRYRLIYTSSTFFLQFVCPALRRLSPLQAPPPERVSQSSVSSRVLLCCVCCPLLLFCAVLCLSVSFLCPFCALAYRCCPLLRPFVLSCAILCRFCAILCALLFFSFSFLCALLCVCAFVFLLCVSPFPRCLRPLACYLWTACGSVYPTPTHSSNGMHSK